MRTATHFIAASLLSLVIVCGNAHAQKKKYPIQIDRPRELGQSYVINSVVTTRQQLKAAMKGSTIKEEDSTYVIRFVADAKVTGRDEEEGSASITYIVRECIRTSGDDTIVLAPRGTELLFVKASGDKKLRSKDGSIDEEVLDDIDDAITEIGLGSSGMGSFSPKAVGEKWDISKSLLAWGFMEGNDDFIIRDKGVKAIATLAEVSESAATPSMKVKVDITLKDFKLRQLQGFKIAKSNALVTFVGNLPLDETESPLGAELSMDFTIKASGKPDPELPKIDMEMRFMRAATTTYTYN